MALTIGDRVAALRNRLMANPAFHRWAFSVPGVRAIALRHTREVFDLCAGFVYSQVLLACVKVRLFDMLAEGPLTPQDIAARCGLPLASVERLLKAAASLGLVEARSAGRLGLGQRGAAIAADPSIGAMIEHHATLYADLADPVALLSSDKPKTGMAAYWPYAGAKNPGGVASDQAQTYSALMATSQGMVSAQVLDAYDFTRHRCLLDVGGGSGAFVVPVARRAPKLSVRVFDLPAVAQLAAARFEQEGLSDRAQAIGGDFYRDSLPAGADIITLIRVLFDHDDAGAVAILRGVRAALPDTGVLLIAEPMPTSSRRDPIADAYFNFYLLAMGRGRTRTLVQFAALLEDVGFGVPRLIAARNPLLTGLIVVQPKKKA